MPEKNGKRIRELMEEIMLVRFSDLEREKACCGELLMLAEQERDLYGSAYARIYLGSYYVTQNDSYNCASFLLEGLRISQEEGYQDLQIYAYTMLGIHFEMAGDEHSAMEYHMEGLKLASSSGDVFSECRILNNIGYGFQQYHSYEQAKFYCRAAYDRIQAKGTQNRGGEGEEQLIRIVMVSNLAELCLLTGQLEQALSYCWELEGMDSQIPIKDIYVYRNRCCYYAATKDKYKALICAKLLLKKEEYIRKNRLLGFDLYHLMCKNMVAVGCQDYALRFFDLMRENADEHVDGHLLPILSMRMRISFRFGSDQDRELAYKEYYEKRREIWKSSNQVRAEALKSKIRLHQVMKEQADMKEKKRSLEREANLDELTHLYNRRYFNQLKSQYSSNPKIGRIGIIMLDVDFLKEYNDGYGHPKGDAVLELIARCMLKHCNRQIFVCRFGGDEFCCLCVDQEDEQIERFIRDVCQDLYGRAVPHVFSSCSDRVTLSVGYANEDVHLGIQTYELFDMADRALYKSKIKGRNCFTKWHYDAEEAEEAEM